MEATKAALMKNYATGIHFESSFNRDHCVPCLVGKSPQRSYTFYGHRAMKVGELLHMDLCGPYPVQAPHREKYFFNILDDRTNWGFTYGLHLKSDAFHSYLTTKAFFFFFSFKRSNSAVVLAVRSGGELELTARQMGAHFTSKGIVLQCTVAYAHQQNGKVKDTYGQLKKVDRLFWQILVSLCPFGLMQSSLSNTLLIDCLCLPCQ